jgi:hypothetical protein
MQAAESLVYPCLTTKVAVVEAKGEYKVIATEDLSEGDIILTVEGRETDVASKYSVQISDTLHIDVDRPELVEQHPERYLWRFLNHQCEPNAYLKGRELHAISNIKNGEEITFNYNANEYEMASPFACWCDAHADKGIAQVRGFKYLDKEQRNRLAPYLSDHIRKLIQG